MISLPDNYVLRMSKPGHADVLPWVQSAFKSAFKKNLDDP